MKPSPIRPAGVPADSVLVDLVTLKAWVGSKPMVFQSNFDHQLLDTVRKLEGPQAIACLARTLRGFYHAMTQMMSYEPSHSYLDAREQLFELATEFELRMPGARHPFYIRRVGNPTVDGLIPAWAIAWGDRSRHTVLTRDGVFEIEPTEIDQAWVDRARYTTPEEAASGLHAFWEKAPTWVEVLGCGTGYQVREAPPNELGEDLGEGEGAGLTWGLNGIEPITAVRAQEVPAES